MIVCRPPGNGANIHGAISHKRVAHSFPIFLLGCTKCTSWTAFFLFQIAHNIFICNYLQRQWIIFTEYACMGFFFLLWVNIEMLFELNQIFIEFNWCGFNEPITLKNIFCCVCPFFPSYFIFPVMIGNSLTDKWSNDNA